MAGAYCPRCPGIVNCRTFFVVQIQNIAGPRRLDITAIVISTTFFVELIPQTPHWLLVFNLNQDWDPPLLKLCRAS